MAPPAAAGLSTSALRPSVLRLVDLALWSGERQSPEYADNWIGAAYPDDGKGVWPLRTWCRLPGSHHLLRGRVSEHQHGENPGVNTVVIDVLGELGPTPGAEATVACCGAARSHPPRRQHETRSPSEGKMSPSASARLGCKPTTTRTVAVDRHAGLLHGAVGDGVGRLAGVAGEVLGEVVAVVGGVVAQPAEKPPVFSVPSGRYQPLVPGLTARAGAARATRAQTSSTATSIPVPRADGVRAGVSCGSTDQPFRSLIASPPHDLSCEGPAAFFPLTAPSAPRAPGPSGCRRHRRPAHTRCSDRGAADR